MALIKSTTFAPDIYKALNGVLLIYKPPRISSGEIRTELRARITDSLNQYAPRPISKRIVIEDGTDNEKSIIEKPNLADHPLVVGPRYVPWELSLSIPKPLGYRSSGVGAVLLGLANRSLRTKMMQSQIVSIYHITGRFGYIMDTFFYDGKIMDKTSYRHVRSGRLDAALSRIESSQYERLFDSSTIPLNSEEAYELAKAWPSKPPRMARWPVIYRIRCIHLKLPEFKLEVTVTNETEQFLAQISQDVATMLKTGAYTESIRRVQFGPFKVDECLTDKDWELQPIINNLSKNNARRDELHKTFDDYRAATAIRTSYEPDTKEQAIMTT